MTRLKPLLSHTVFRWVSGGNALLALALGVLGTLMGTHPDLRRVHAVMATVFLGTSLVTALTGMRYGRVSNTRGLALLGFALFGVGVVQYGLGDMAMTWPHMILGFGIVLAAGILFVRSLHQPVVHTGSRFADRGEGDDADGQPPHADSA